MGKSLPSTSKLYQFTKMASPNFKSQKPIPSETRIYKPESSRSGGGTSSSDKLKLKADNNNNNNNTLNKQTPVPLAEVVSDCVKRWFVDTLKEAKAGDSAMQVLVGQMYSSGYGTPKDPQKGKAWLTRASKTRSTALKVGYKQPGYNLSDSDSVDDIAAEMK